MARSSEPIEILQRPLGSADAATVPGTHQPSASPTSPARSDKSSDSEGKPVRKQLQDTTLEPHTSDPTTGTDLAMGEVTNGTDAAGELSGSGSESGRGRLRRKRSRDEFEDEEKPQGKKIQESHIRKKSRDLSTSNDRDQEGDSPMAESEDAPVAPQSQDVTPEKKKNEDKGRKIISPKNKRTLDQTKSGEDLTSGGEGNDQKIIQVTSVVGDERDSKRQRDAVDTTYDKKDPIVKISLDSGFANTSAASPFAVLTPKSPEGSSLEKEKEKEKEKDKGILPQTSEDKFKASGFGSFAASSASPFGAVSKTTSSPFGAATSSKLSSFAAPSPTAKSSGFGMLGADTKKSASAFGSTAVVSNGGSVFGGSLGASAFGGLGGTKPGSLGFGTPGAQAITGLKQNSNRKFGQKAEEESEDEDEAGEGEDDSDTEQDSEKPQHKFSSHVEPIETGEEGEAPEWIGRGKLYTIAGEGKERGWQERGTGPLKLNVTIDTPTKARFILRADSTHRLILNAAITKNLKFGDAEGNKPTDGRLIFNTPTADGKLEMHTIRMKVEKASELWEIVDKIKDSL